MIYLDYNASTPVAPEALAAFLACAARYGNPSSSHAFGVALRAAIEAARAEVAALVGASAAEIVFTSGATEANNHVLVRATEGRVKPHVVVSAVEHPSVLAPAQALAARGAISLSVVAVDRFGRVDLTALERALSPETALVSVMHAQNEIGTLQPVADVVAVAQRFAAERGARLLVHTDAAQSAGKIPVDAHALGVDLLTLAGHKLYAPVGVGALFVRSGVELAPLLYGGPQQRGLRAGTESAPLAAALGAACRLAREAPCAGRLAALAERLWEGLRRAFGDAVVRNGHPSERLPNTLHVSFLGRSGHDVLAAAPEVLASGGSACHADGGRLSGVLAAMGVDERIGRGAVRFSVGRQTNEDEIDAALAALARAC